jgi:hypothetical protein
MPTRAASRPATVAPFTQHASQQDLYHQEPDLAGRLRTRSAVNYAQQPAMHTRQQQQQDSAHELRLRNRNSRPNYKEPDEEFVPEEEETVGYGSTSSRPRRGQQPRNYTEGYNVNDGDGDFKPEGTSEVHLRQTHQQTTVHYEPTANGTVDPAATTTTTKEEQVEVAVTSRGRLIRKKNLIESSDEDDDIGLSTTRRITRKGNEDFIAPDNDDDEEVDLGDDSFGQKPSRLTRARASQLSQKRPDKKSNKDSRRRDRSSRKRIRNEGSEDDYVDEDDDFSDSVIDEEIHRTSPSLPPSDDEIDTGPKTYGFRSRQGQPMNYNEIAAFEKMEANGAAQRKKSKPKKAKMNWTGKDYETAWGPLPGQSDSDSDAGRTPKKGVLPGLGLPGTPGSGMLAGGAGLPMDLSGTPSNLGRIGEAGLADADPLGVNVNVSFDDVGGLDERE